MAALVVMALTLALVFRARLRLLPLVVALAAAGLTFGALSLAGASLTMASIAVLPVLIGLAVDYAIQLQARVQEAQAAGAGIEAAVQRTATRGAPTVATAAAATAAGFLVLALSPVPMVRGFGLLLVAGIALALGCALTLGVAALAGSARLGRRRRPLGALGALGPAWRGAGELIAANRASLALRRRGAAAGRGALRLSTAHPGRVVLVALVVALAGWGLETQTRVESDLTKLVPQNGAIHDLQALQRSTDVGGEIDVVVSGGRVTDPAVVKWMTSYQAAVLKRFGYSAKRGCGKAELCPAFSLPDLFQGGQNTTRQQIEGLLDAVPAYFSQGVITADRRTATMAFGIRLMPLDRQEQVIAAMRDRLHPPAGIDAELAGLPVLAAEANAAVSSPWRRLATLLAGLAAVALVLLVAFRAWQRAFVPLLPIALATGWSALVLFALRIPLNPMSVVLGALVIAISTEFSVLLAERYRAERIAGHEPGEALAAHVPVDRGRGAGLGHDGHRRLRGARRLGHQDAARLRLRDGGRPHRRPARGDGRAAGGAAAGRAGAAAAAGAEGGRAPHRRAARPDRVSAPRPPRLPGGAHRYGWFLAVVGRGAHRLRVAQHAAHPQRGLAGPEDRLEGAALRRAAGAGQPSTATSTSPARPTRARRAGGRPARCAGRRSSTRARWPRAARSCSPSWPRAARSARASSTASRACGRAIRACRWPPSRSAATATTCARSCAGTAGASPSPGIATASWPTCSASPSARS